MNLRGDVLRTRYGQVNGEFNHLVTRIGAEIDVLERPLATSAATAPTEPPISWFRPTA